MSKIFEDEKGDWQLVSKDKSLTFHSFCQDLILKQDSKQSLRKPEISKKPKKGKKRITKRKQVKSVATHLGLCQELTPACPAGKTRPGGVTLCLSSLSICTNKQ